jgi:hypothetical protein
MDPPNGEWIRESTPMNANWIDLFRVYSRFVSVFAFPFCDATSETAAPKPGVLQTPNAKRQTPNAKRQTPNAKRQTPNAKRQTPNA